MSQNRVFKPAEIRSMESWQERRQRMSPRKWGIALLVFLIIIASLLAISAARAEAQVAPHDQAASVKITPELYQKQLKAKIAQWKQWDSEVTPLSLDEVWTWIGDDEGKARFIAARYNYSLSPKESAVQQIGEIKFTMEEKRRLRQEISRQLGYQLTGLVTQVDQISNRVTRLESDMSAIKVAVIQNKFNIAAALSVLETMPAGDKPDSNTVNVLIRTKMELSSRR